MQELPKEIQQCLNNRFLSTCKKSAEMFPGLEKIVLKYFDIDKKSASPDIKTDLDLPM